MSIKPRPQSKTVQSKLLVDPPPMCARDEKHGPSQRGRDDHLCKNCGEFKDHGKGQPIPRTHHR
jgi:hypothetical protein